MPNNILILIHSGYCPVLYTNQNFTWIIRAQCAENDLFSIIRETDQ